MKKNEVIANLKKLSLELKDKKYIVAEDVRSVPKLGYYIWVHYRTLGKALQKAGLPSSKLASSLSMRSEDLLKYLRELQKELGRTPTVRDIEQDKKIYKRYAGKKFSWKIFKTRFGGLKKAREIAELGVTNDISSTKALTPKKDEAEDFEFIQEKKRYWGQAAELHVVAELLYRGYQAANIPVDVGLDILAVKKNKTYYFQVKHKDLSNNKAISLTKSSFVRTGGGNVYFIFVLLSDKKREFLIVPFHIVNDWIREGLAGESDKSYLICINKDNGDYSLKGKSLNKHLNGWKDIK